MIDIKKYSNPLIHPVEVFKLEKKNANLGDAIKNILIAGLFSGVFMGLLSTVNMLIGNTLSIGSQFAVIGTVLLAITSIFIFPILAVGTLLMNSAIYYVFAKIFGGKGDFTTQTYLISLYLAPLLIIMSMLNAVPFIASVLFMLIVAYSFWPLTVVLRETHGYTTKRAILTWLLPLAILILIISGIFWLISSSVPGGSMGTPEGFDAIEPFSLAALDYRGNFSELFINNAGGTARIINCTLSNQNSGPCECIIHSGDIDQGGIFELKATNCAPVNAQIGEPYTLSMRIAYVKKTVDVTSMSSGTIEGQYIY